MARLRIRFKFNPGRDGAALDKLGEFSVQVEKFLRSLTSDLGLETRKGEWIGRNFKDGSVGFDGEYAGRVDDTLAAKSKLAIAMISSANPLEAANKGVVSFGTMSEFARIGRTMAPDEHFDIGTYSDDVAMEPSAWTPIPYGLTAEIRRLMDAPYVSCGSTQGVMHGWTMEGKELFFTVRELSSGVLVKCKYDRLLHGKVHEATETPNSVVLVYGDMEWDRASNAIIAISANDVEITRRLSDAEFDALFGSAPEYAGSSASSEYIAWLRGDDE